MEEARSTPRYWSVLVAPLSTLGTTLGLILAWFSFGSSLLPRPAMMQGAIAALSFAFGYAVGVLLWLLIRWGLGLMSKELPDPPSSLARLPVVAAGAMIVIVIFRWPAWQSEQRLLVGLEEIGLVDGTMAIVWTIGLTAVLLLLGRSIRWLVWKLDVFNGRHMPIQIGRVVTSVILFGLLGVLVWFVTSGGLVVFADQRFGPGDDTTLEGITQPQGPEISGSPESLVEWDDLGFQGRTFTGAATSVDDIQAFYPNSQLRVREPIRVYAGLKSADSAEERAQLVVDELIRTNARDRALLVVVATTGTGWVDPLSAATVEYMYQGDTAIAGMQYSFLPSWISFVLDTATAMEAGIAINDAIIEWWDTLPENDRPTLIAFGESLGTLGSEAAFVQDSLDASLAFIQSKIDGALWIGPTNANQLHRQLVAERDPSPVWKPEYDSGSIVRSVNGPGEIDPQDTTWPEPRVLYYHHPSDPVGYWNWETLWKPQEWTQDPIGYDVPDSVRWVPFTTFTQVLMDLINGFSAAVGFGHNYNNSFVDAWSIVAPKDGWTASDTQRLEDHLTSLDLPGL